MNWHGGGRKVVKVLNRRADSGWFPGLVGGCAFLGAISLTLPAELLVVVGVLMSPSRWMAIGLWTAVGATAATVGLYLAFHHLGWDLLIERFPDITESTFWAYSNRYLSEYGPIALFLVIVLPFPIPKTPALAFVAIYRMPIYEVTLVIGLGEFLRNMLYAYLASRFPRRFLHLYPAAEDADDEKSKPAKEQALVERGRKADVRRW